MLSAVAAAGLLAALIVTFFWYDIPSVLRQYWRRWKLLRAIPNPAHFPPPHWFFGHIPYLYKQNQKLWLDGIQNINLPEHERIRVAKLWLGPIPVLNVPHSEALPALWKEPKTRFIYNFLIPWLGEGLLIAEGGKWLRNRRLLTPAFHYEVLKGYVPMYNSCLSVLLQKWTLSAQANEPVLLFKSLSAMSLDIIMQSAFGFESNCQTAKVRHPYVQACSDLIHLTSDRAMNPFYQIEWLYWLTPHGRKTRKLCQFVHSYAERVISERRKVISLEGSSGEANGLEMHNGKRRKILDFLDILLMARDEEGQGMSDLEIRNEVDTFMFEGHDTTTSAMSWTLYCLAQHPQHQDKIREEVRSVLKGREQLEYEDLKHLNYTSWCIKEAMRLYPPVFYFFRKSTEEIKLKEWVIPKDMIVVIHVMVLHRNRHLWENPEVYDPLRFKPGNEKHGPYDYIPFSAGSRNCIGQNFAMNEMKVVIASIVNRFSLRVDTSHEVEFVPRVVLRSKNDIKIFLDPLEM